MEGNQITEKYVTELIRLKSENRNLDFKEKFNWSTASNEEKAEIVKDILAMSNTQDGGKIIFGVKDGTFDIVGLSEEEYKSFDTTKVNDFLHKYTDPKFSCQVYKFLFSDKDYIVLIDVPEFQEIPIICKNNIDSAKDNGKKILQRGQIYIRTGQGSSETIKSSEEMREFLGRTIIKKGDELLRSIQLLLKGKPLTVEHDSKEKYDKEIQEANTFFKDKFSSEPKMNGSWEVYAYPSRNQEKRISDFRDTKKLVEKSVVSLRGWDFPHIESRNSDKEGSGYYVGGFQSNTNWIAHIEAFRFYQSGLFASKNILWEDTEDKTKDKKVLSFIGAIFSVTEFFLFFKRLYEEIIPDESLMVKIVLDGCKGRKLTSLNSNVFFPYNYTCNEETIVIEENIKVIELRTSYLEISLRILKQIFCIFNWDRVTDEIISQWQTNLIERKF